jgi:hypothetical protein
VNRHVAIPVEPSVKIAMSNVLLALISLALIVSASSLHAQQLNDGDVLAPSHATIMQKLAQLRGYSAAGTHQCTSDKSRICVVAGSGFSTATMLRLRCRPAIAAPLRQLVANRAASP